MRSPIYTLGAFKLALCAARIAPRWLGKIVSFTIAKCAAPPTSLGFAEIRENLQVVTGLTGVALHRLCAQNIRNFADMLADYFHVFARGGQAANAMLRELRGWEHIEAARQKGRGFVLVTGHLGNWELGGVLLALRGVPMTVVTLEEPSRELTRLREEYRRRLGIKTLYVGPGHEFAFLEMIKLLQRNECVAMLVDRPYPGTGTPVDFCGRRCEFSNAPALLWQHTGAAIIPAFVVRSGTWDYLCFAEPPVAMQADENRRAALQTNTQKIADVFETVIRRFPHHWFNYARIFSSPVPTPATPEPALL